MKNAKKLTKKAFQSGVSFGAGLTALIISFVFFKWVPTFQYIAQLIYNEQRAIWGSVVFRYETRFYRVVSFVSALQYILFAIGTSLITIGILTEYYRRRNEKRR